MAMATKQQVLKWMRENVSQFTGHDGVNYYVGHIALAQACANHFGERVSDVPQFYFDFAFAVAAEHEKAMNE